MMIFWYLAYGPRYFQHVRVVNPSDILKQREKEITSVDLTDALKKMKPETKSLQKNQAETKKPTIDQKTLEAMRKAEPPRPQPPAQPEQPPAPQVAQQQPLPPTQPPPTNQFSDIEAPKAKPAPTAPNFNTGPSNPGDAIRQAARAAAQAPPTFGGELGGGAKNGPTSSGGVQILSDTMGVDFDPYLKRIVYDTERAWWPIIPEVARPPLNKVGRVLIRFKILKDGSVKEMLLEGPSGDVSLDRAAWGGILGASPFPSSPKSSKAPISNSVSTSSTTSNPATSRRRWQPRNRLPNNSANARSPDSSSSSRSSSSPASTTPDSPRSSLTAGGTSGSAASSSATKLFDSGQKLMIADTRSCRSLA